MAEIHDGHVYYIGVQLNPNKVIEASKDDGVHRAFIRYYIWSTLDLHSWKLKC